MAEITTRPHMFKKSESAWVDANGEHHPARSWEEPSGRVIAERGSVSAFAGTEGAAIRMVETIEATRDA